MYELGFYIPKDGILHSHRRTHLKSYTGEVMPFLLVVSVTRNRNDIRFACRPMGLRPAEKSRERNVVTMFSLSMNYGHISDIIRNVKEREY
jgi:hypothetical protein